MKRFLFGFGLWTSILMLVAKGALKLTGIDGSIAVMVKDYAFDLVLINTTVMTGLQGYDPTEIKLPDGVRRAFALLFFLFVPMFLIGQAHAQTANSGAMAIPATPISDLLPLKSKGLSNPFAQPYDPGRCGGYFGVNTIGLAGAVNGSVAPGTQVVQGGIGGEIGYGCPINAASGSFWFAEVMADVTNLNGNVNGLSLSGPVSFTERFGFGTPLTNMLPNFFGTSSSSSPAMPSLPLLPSGVTAGPGNPYAFVAAHQYDVSAYDGLSQNRQWLFSYGVGLGMLYRLSNQVVADTFAEYQFASNSFCYGPLGTRGCDQFGQRAMVGVELKY